MFSVHLARIKLSLQKNAHLMNNYDLKRFFDTTKI